MDTKNKSFGRTGAVFLLLLLGIRGIKSHQWTWDRSWKLLLAVLILEVIAETAPQFLEFPRLAFTYLSEKINRITQPLILGIIFFLVLTPMALIWRFLGKSKIFPNGSSNTRSASQTTYWIPVSPHRNYAWMRKQF